MKVLVLFDLPRPVGPDETFTMRALREQEDRPTEADVISALGKLGHQVDTLAVYDNALAVVEKVRDYAPDVVFNLCESFFNERSNEPNIPALLELLRVPYTGAGPDSLLLCKDKELAKTILVYHRIRVPRFVVSRKRSAAAYSTPVSAFRLLSSHWAKSLRTASRRHPSDGTKRIRSSAPVFCTRSSGATS